MTFAEYNTDKNFDDKKSSLEELVKIGLNEGKTSDEIRSSLSPKWQKSKKIGQFDDYVTMYSTPKEEPKKEEVKENITANVEAPTKEVPSLNKDDAKHFNQIDSIAKNAEKTELENVENQSNRNWKSDYDTISKQGELFGQIDDRLVAQFPTFVVKRYADGEFGDPKSSDAKLRLAHFMINGVQSKLKNASNAAMIAAGRSPMFSDTTSDYEKYQQTNFAQGLENRWNKYKQETQAAIDLAKKEGMTEQDARLAVQKLTRDNTLNTKWNMMNEKQKLYALSITKEMGDYIGDLGADELANFVAGAALNENNISKDEIIAIGIAKLASKSPEILANLPEGGIKDLVASMIGGNGVDAVAGIGGAGGKTNSNGDQTNLTGNLQNYESIDGSNISFDFSDSKANDKIKGELNKLTTKYKNGEIDAETFKKYYDPLYAEGKKHFGSIFTTPSSDKALRSADTDVLISLDEEFTNLNTQAKAGELSPAAYQKQIEALTEKATKYGASKEMLEKIKDKTLSNEKILKAVEKASKKKK